MMNRPTTSRPHWSRGFTRAGRDLLDTVATIAIMVIVLLALFILSIAEGK